MIQIWGCPNCGGPIIKDGVLDTRCAVCAMTYLEFIEFFGDEVEVMEDFVGLEDTAIELGYPVSGNVDDQDIQW